MKDRVVRAVFAAVVVTVLCVTARADWAYDAAAGTITDENGIVLKVAAATDGLKVTGVTTLNGQTKIDLSKSVANAEGAAFAIAEVGGIGGSSKAAALQTVKEVVLPAGLKRISASAFMRCRGLEKVTPFLPDTVETIGASAFNRCPNLGGDLVISNHKVVNKLMFLAYSDNTTKLASINLWKSGVTCIEWNAFYYNRGLVSFYLSRDFEGFDPVNTAQNTFGGCSNLWSSADR